MIHTLANIAGPAFALSEAGLYEIEPGDLDALLASHFVRIFDREGVTQLEITKAGRLELRKPRGKPPRKEQPEPIPDPPEQAGFSLPEALSEALASDAALDEEDELFSGMAEAQPNPPYTPDFTIIPDALTKFAQEDETAAQFRARLKLLWQRFGIEDGKNFPGGGEALTGEEKITMREIDIVLNSEEGQKAGLLEWMKADRPQD